MAGSSGAIYVSATNFIADIWNFENISKSRGYDQINFEYGKGEYYTEHTESSPSALSIYVEASDSTTITNLNINNAEIGAGSTGFIHVASQNVVLQDVNVKDVPESVKSSLEYNYAIDWVTYNNETGYLMKGIHIDCGENAVISNINLENYTLSDYCDEFIYVSASNGRMRVDQRYLDTFNVIVK